ncbi:hypothetical protein BpHYR1_041798 [Brachionus plicatilis]|uniref:Uncharacterized protein n=1 Tax=Brachionus plicatilis TaxID=10195 RepID=A0A3M7R0L0_BRAPC|nr:hypothetical protein BpHYR1_041798 [Brachionus plicatilis]
MLILIFEPFLDEMKPSSLLRNADDIINLVCSKLMLIGLHDMVTSLLINLGSKKMFFDGVHFTENFKIFAELRIRLNKFLQYCTVNRTIFAQLWCPVD